MQPADVEELNVCDNGSLLSLNATYIYHAAQTGIIFSNQDNALTDRCFAAVFTFGIVTITPLLPSVIIPSLSCDEKQGSAHRCCRAS